MSNLAFDTYATIKRLAAVGMPEAQAEAVVSTINHIRDSDLHNLATKDDLARLEVAFDIKLDKVETSLNAKIDKVEGSLKVEIAALDTKIDKVESSLNTKIDKVESSLNAKIDKVETSLKVEIAAVRADTTVLRWMSGFTLAALMAIFYLLLRPR